MSIHKAPVRNTVRVPFGITGLDDILEGGLPAGHLYLLEGTPGAGKTTLALQMILNAHQSGQRVLYISMSESRRELRAIAASHGWELDGVATYELTPQEDSLKADQQYSIFNPEDVELTQITDLISKKVEEVRPEVVIVDSLSELRLLARDNFRYRRQMLALKNFFEERRCTVLLLDNRTQNHDEQQIHSIVHGVIGLEVLGRDYGIERRRLRVQKTRGSKFREGFHDYRIATGGVVVYPRLVSAEHRQSHKPEVLKTGIAEIDRLLKGGITRGTSTLLIGPAGVGKSSLAAHFAHSALQRGESAAIYVFDETAQVYLERCAGLGADLQPYIDSGKLHFQPLDPAEMAPGEFVADIRRTVAQKKATVVVIDSLNGCLNAMPNEIFMQLQMHELLTYLGMQGVSTFLVLAQQGMIGPMQSSVDISYLADSVMLLRYFEAAGGIRKAISVLKKRSGPHESTIRELQLKPGAIVVGAPLKTFHGVLTGTPQYTGNSKPLMEAANGEE